MPAPAHVQFSSGRSLFLATFIVCGFFAVVEGGLRVVGIAPSVQPRILLRQMDTDITLPFMRADSDVFWSPQPGYRGTFQGRPVTINALGLRGAAVTTGRLTRGRRLLSFGDSITFGYGVGDEETYPFELGRHLAGSGVSVVNAGVTGFTSHQVLGYVRRFVPLLQPDVVSVCIGWNDGNQRTADDREYARRLALARNVEGTLERLYLYRALKNAYLRAGIRASARAPRSVPRVSTAQYRENLEAIVAEVRRAGARPVFMALPRRKTPGEPGSRDTPYAAVLARTARELDVPLFGVADLGIETTRQDTTEYFIDSLHLSPEGASLMAGILAPQFLASGVLGP
jgi:lysophospholipase L1-like esterase